MRCKSSRNDVGLGGKSQYYTHTHLLMTLWRILGHTMLYYIRIALLLSVAPKYFNFGFFGLTSVYSWHITILYIDENVIEICTSLCRYACTVCLFQLIVKLVCFAGKMLSWCGMEQMLQDIIPMTEPTRPIQSHHLSRNCCRFFFCCCWNQNIVWIIRMQPKHTPTHTKKRN